MDDELLKLKNVRSKKKIENTNKQSVKNEKENRLHSYDFYSLSNSLRYFTFIFLESPNHITFLCR